MPPQLDALDLDIIRALQQDGRRSNVEIARDMGVAESTVRKRLDLEKPVELEAIRACLRIAQQAPSGSNQQPWHFIVVRDAHKRRQLADLYRRAFDQYREMPTAAGHLFHDDPQRAPQQRRVMDSAEYLAAHMHEVPVHVIPCMEGRPPTTGPMPMGIRWSSLYPAVWSFMLAARERGLGSSLTTLHLFYEREAAEVLGIPYDDVAQSCLVPVAYTKGTAFKPAQRQPLDGVLHLDGWRGKT